MGIWSKIKSIFKKSEKPKLLNEGNYNKKYDYDQLDKAYKEYDYDDLDKAYKEIQKDNEDFRNMLKVSFENKNSQDLTKNKTSDNMLSKTADELVEGWKKDASVKNRQDYLKDNPEARLDSLLKSLKRKEQLENFGLNYKFSGSKMDVLDQYNYQKISDNNKNPELLFMPYLKDLEEANGLYEEKDMPKSIKEIYNIFKKGDSNNQRACYLTGMALGVEMGIYDLENYTELFNDEELEKIKAQVELDKFDLKQTLPPELKQYVTKGKTNDDEISR